MSDIRDVLVGGRRDARRRVSFDRDSLTECGFASRQHDQLRGRPVQREHGPGRRHRQVDQINRFVLRREGVRFQRPSRDQLQPMQNTGAVRAARHPQIAALLVDPDCRHLFESGRLGPDQIHRVIRAVADHDQFPSAAIAEQESARDDVVGEPGQLKRRRREAAGELRGVGLR